MADPRHTMKTSADHRTAPTDTLRQQAWVWLRLLKSGDVKQWDAQRFQHWLDASPAHKAAFADARQRWEAFQPAAAELLRSSPKAARFHAQAAQRTRSQAGRRAFLGAAAAGAAAVAAVALVHPPGGLWPPLDGWGADYRTATGEQRSVTLAGRVNVMLNTQTRIRREATREGVPSIALLAGEAAIDLPAGGQRFGVIAAGGQSVADGGRFEVRHLDGKVCVTCLEGKVRVAHPAGVRELQASQQTVYDGRSIAGIASIDPLNVSAWRSGELVFRQTKLSLVLAEINRYRPGRVVLVNDAVRDMPVSGSFYIASLDRALAQLQHSFDLEARALPGGLLILS
ncbi:FecR family protein [Cupriavidus sp. USMAHM13]|uniref:FecR family protein n=1 Tax=Cupriavidus sp. USMAHM13 TaxID=1389192 RepID=UPI0009F60CFC|nr:FecR domain-containing protein [Cupriavidus sp. USMAHM13]